MCERERERVEKREGVNERLREKSERESERMRENECKRE